ncbi:hypothetical protein GGX14DRAFT_391538 [Mycena pura]|uniref:Uncharacterized protein n=1 Tax=Mycena pura TaxID=153505 RepID=A0AAD6VNY0_9AGAR|nr:hypothetical protein GGX14DRAFT_391538 [Mycena pura]
MLCGHAAIFTVWQRVCTGIEIVFAIMHSACHGYNDPAVEVIVPSLHMAQWTGIMMYAGMYIDIPYMLLSHVFFVGYVVVRIVMGFVVIYLILPETDVNFPRNRTGASVDGTLQSGVEDKRQAGGPIDTWFTERHSPLDATKIKTLRRVYKMLLFRNFAEMAMEDILPPNTVRALSKVTAD